MSRNRVAKLERFVQERLCRGGRVDTTPNLDATDIEFDRLSRAELEDLSELIRVITEPPCSRCGRSARDLARMTDEHLNRALALLRKLFGYAAPQGTLAATLD